MSLPKPKTLLKMLAPSLFTFACLIGLRLLGPHLLDQARLSRWIAPLGHFGPLLYIALLAVRPLTLISGQLVAAVGGMLFGSVAATLYTLAGDALAMLLVFSLARRYGRRLMKRIAKSKYPALTRAARRHDFTFAMLTTINPLVPTDVANAAAAASGARLWPTVAGGMLATAPGVYLTTQFGSALSQGQELATLLSAAGMVVSLLLGVALGRRVMNEIANDTPAPAATPPGRTGTSRSEPAPA